MAEDRKRGGGWLAQEDMDGEAGERQSGEPETEGTPPTLNPPRPAAGVEARARAAEEETSRLKPALGGGEEDGQGKVGRARQLGQWRVCCGRAAK